MMRKAMVFISCGQSTEREKKIGFAIDSYFKGRKFKTYLAERVHSPEALTESIFSSLQKSEYFVFVDFNREKLDSNKSRGSLFVNQEIAIATFLKLPGLGFTEKGVKREGILKYQIFNSFSFEDEAEILNRLPEETKDWDNESVNELYLRYDPETTTRDTTLKGPRNAPKSDWYHIDVWNRNKNKHAFSCNGYITQIKNLDSGQNINLPTNEIIWAGISDISVNIMADGKRELDAFYVRRDYERIYFHQRRLTTTNPKYHLPDLRKGKYLITYTIISNNFPMVSKDFRLIYDDTQSNIYFGD